MTAPTGHEPVVGNARGLHWQRLLARGMRRWRYACLGALLGGALVWQAHQQDIEKHLQAEQEVARLAQLLAALPVRQASPAVQPFPVDFLDKLASLPGVDQAAPMWNDVHQAFATQGLQWLSMRPVPPTAKPEAADRWPSLAVVVRLKGRFEDWVQAWETLADMAVPCSIDKISVAATAVPAEVQIDAVLRVWMRPVRLRESPQTVQVWQRFAQSQKRLPAEKWPLLFAQAPSGPVASASGLGGASVQVPGAQGVAIPMGELSELTEDPRQWPLSRVRLVGLLQQGESRQAILTAGGHWARVSPGQRVTQEGHRVVAITDDGVRLRLAQGAQFSLDWLDGRVARQQGIKK